MKEQDKNIVFIGMPGCGKTTIGKILSSRLNKKFIDMDNYIEFKMGCSIPEIFKKGEEYFRKIESEAVEEVSEEKNSVISTGGGVIKKMNNIENLKKNGVIIFIDRPLENIMNDVDIARRPLLQNGTDAIKKIFSERYDIYKNVCNFTVDNIYDIEKLINNVILTYNQHIKLM